MPKEPSVPISPVVTIDDRLRRSAGIAHPRPFVLEIVVTKDDLSDLLPHMNNVRTLHWIDRVAEAHATAAGWSRPALMASGLMWFVVRHEIDYRAECFEGERLLLCTWVRSAVGVRSWRETVIVRADRARHAPECASEPREIVAVRAATLWVLVELSTRRPRRIPEAMIAPLDPLEPHAPSPSSAEVRSPTSGSPPQARDTVGSDAGATADRSSDPCARR